MFKTFDAEGNETSTLKDFLQESSSIRVRSKVVAEWNLNVSDNIEKIGNYRYRPGMPTATTKTLENWGILTTTYDSTDALYAYTKATNSDIAIDGGFEGEDIENPVPVTFLSSDEKMKYLYSLESCFDRFRPRSGITKSFFLREDQRIPTINPNMARQPRQYPADKDDKFKYWTSFRFAYGEPNFDTIPTPERGISQTFVGGDLDGFHVINDAVPFVVYRNQIPANRIVIKMQTNVGDIDLGPYFDPNKNATIPDPFYGDSNKTTPIKWKVQTLIGNNWTDHPGIDFASDVVDSDGYVQLNYGLVPSSIPEEFLDNIVFAEEYVSTDLLPQASVLGYAYLVRSLSADVGTYYVWNGGTSEIKLDNYTSFVPEYDWHLGSDTMERLTPFVNTLVSPEALIYDGETKYREFAYIRGIRVVVDIMNTNDTPFDLIEISPRLAVDLSDKVEKYSIKKDASDIGVTGLPVGQLLASTGTLDMFDYDNAFGKYNNESILNSFNQRNLQIKFYETVADVNGYDYQVPIKTMYADGFPTSDNETRSVNVDLKDLFFYFDGLTAPQLFIPEASLSFAVSMLMDSIGFSNYTFKRVQKYIDGVAQVDSKNNPIYEDDPIIPYFFVGPDTSLSEVLQELALSTQTAMFFDEYNNLVLMSKNYILPTEAQRPTDLVLRGSNDQTDAGILENESSNAALSNILGIASATTDVFNDGKINFSSRYIQKSFSTLRQAGLLDNDRSWNYKPVLLWEATGTDNTKSVNEDNSKSSAYSLSAVPLNTNLSNKLPRVIANVAISAVTNGTNTITYTASNTFVPGDYVTVIGSNPEYYNVSSRRVVSASSTQFVVAKNADTQTPGTYVANSAKAFVIRNNTIDLGEGVYWVSRYKSHFYANGEIIKYDAVEYSISGMGNRWVSSYNEYQNYFAQVPFGGKIFPTGRVRIYTELFYGSDGLIDDDRSYTDTDGTTVASGAVAKHGRGQFGTQIAEHSAGIPSHWQNNSYVRSINMDSKLLYSGGTLPATKVGKAGKVILSDNTDFGTRSRRGGIVKNILSTEYFTEAQLAKFKTASPGSVQSSALVFDGPNFAGSMANNIADYVSYVYKPFNNNYKHFGTRMRIVGESAPDKDLPQSPVGSMFLTYAQPTGSGYKTTAVGGAAGGIAIGVDPTSNVGYYFELAALTSTLYEKVNKTSNFKPEPINNVFFYKVKRNATVGSTDATKAVPELLWSAPALVVVDDGMFTGQSKQTTEKTPTVYDLSVEYGESTNGSLTFYLYINNILVATVVDSDPVPLYNNLALFVRGTSKVMFENVYAIEPTYSMIAKAASIGKEPNDTTRIPVNPVFGTKNITNSDATRKYAISGAVQSTFLEGIGPTGDPKYKMYYEEFGTIMREVSYFNVRYDKAYPALYARMLPSFSNNRSYVISGFTANSYGAEFLVFNASDFVLNLDSSAGNWLRIQGITFTQESKHELTVDEFYNKRADYANTDFSSLSLTDTPVEYRNAYTDIKNSRITYGRKDFTLEAPYIQSQEAAEDLMNWIVSKNMRPRNAIGIDLFGMPILQLGDIVEIDYTDSDDNNVVSATNSRYVVYSMQYDRSGEGPSHTVYLSEVV